MAQTDADPIDYSNPPDLPGLRGQPLHPKLAVQSTRISEVVTIAHDWQKRRSYIRKNLKQGHLSLPTLLTEPNLSNPLIHRMKVRDLLRSMPGIHTTRVNKILERFTIAENKRVHGLNDRQRQALIDFFAVDHSITLEEAIEPQPRKPHPSFYPPGADGRKRAMTPWEKKFRAEEWNNQPIKAHQLRKSRENQTDWRIKFARELVSHTPFNLTRAAKAAGVTIKTARDEMLRNPDLQEVVEEVRQAMKDKLLEAAWQMGVEGEREEIFFNGEVVGYKLIRNVAMTQFVAKALDPEMYDSKVRAARITANALTDVSAARQRMMMEDESKNKFAEFDAVRQKALAGKVIDAEIVEIDSDAVEIES